MGDTVKYYVPKFFATVENLRLLVKMTFDRQGLDGYFCVCVDFRRKSCLVENLYVRLIKLKIEAKIY